MMNFLKIKLNISSKKLKSYHLQPNRGFTLIELLIVLAIFLMIVAVIVTGLRTFQVSSQLNESASQFIQTVRLARTRAYSRLNNSAHGVYLDINPSGDDRYILYQGFSYAARQSQYDRIVNLSGVLSFSASLAGTGDANDINFSRGLGAPNKSGTISIIHNVSGSRLVSLNEFGIIEEN